MVMIPTKTGYFITIAVTWLEYEFFFRSSLVAKSVNLTTVKDSFPSTLAYYLTPTVCFRSLTIARKNILPASMSNNSLCFLFSSYLLRKIAVRIVTLVVKTASNHEEVLEMSFSLTVVTHVSQLLCMCEVWEWWGTLQTRRMKPDINA